MHVEICSHTRRGTKGKYIIPPYLFACLHTRELASEKSGIQATVACVHV